MSCIDPIYYSREDNLVPVSYDTHQHASVQTDEEENSDKHLHTSRAFFPKRCTKQNKTNKKNIKKNPVCSGDHKWNQPFISHTHVPSLQPDDLQKKTKILIIHCTLLHSCGGSQLHSPFAVCSMQRHGSFKLVSDEPVMAARLLGSTSRSSRRPSLLTPS